MENLNELKIEVEKKVRVDNFKFNVQQNEMETSLTYPPSTINYIPILLQIFEVQEKCSFETKANKCDCKDILEYAKMMHIIIQINNFLFQNSDYMTLQEQNVLVVESSDILYSCSVEQYKSNFPFEKIYHEEKNVQFVDLKNKTNIDILSTIYFDILSDHAYLPNLTSYFISSFLEQIVKYNSDTLLLYELSLELPESATISHYFSIFFMKQLYLYYFIFNDNSCTVMENEYIESELSSSKTTKFQVEENIMMFHGLKILSQDQMMIMNQYFNMFPDRKENYMIEAVLPGYSYEIIAENKKTLFMETIQGQNKGRESFFIIMNNDDITLTSFELNRLKSKNLWKKIVLLVLMIILFLLYLYLIKQNWTKQKIYRINE